MFGVKAWRKARRSGIGTAHVLAPRGIAWFVALACTLLVGPVASRVVSQHIETIAGARKDAANLVSSLIQHAELTFRTADAILLGVAERLEHEPLNASARERLKTWFTREMKDPAQFTAFGVLDEHGTMVLNMLGDEAPGLDPQRLEFEITETSLLDNQEAHLATIRQLKNLGISLALDDFDTGYSSVTYLTNFPFDKIKIDRSFTQGVLERRDYAAVISSVLALAQGLGKVTTVEGIETEQQFEYMREAGVNLARGYLFSRPVPASQLDFSVRYLPGQQDVVA